MTDQTRDIVERLRDRIEMASRNALQTAEAMWGWRQRDKLHSRAWGCLSRDLREIAEQMSALSNAARGEPMTDQTRDIVERVARTLLHQRYSTTDERINEWRDANNTTWRIAIREAVAAIEATGIEALTKRVAELEALLNTPEVHDFAKGAVLEAAHQRERWPSDHDAGKTPFDWFWLVGYLAQKAASAHVDGNTEKALHHTISTAAALANWHLAISGTDNRMRPGIEPPALSNAAKGEDE
jgi:hypothetical protein